MSGPVFGHGQLRLYLLAALGQGPASGYDIIRALQDRFAGLYSPSAGTVYPRLAKLEEEGLVRRHEQGRRSTYELTDSGRAELEARTDDVARLERDIDAAHRRLADEMRSRVASGSAQVRAELAAAARLAQAAAAALAQPPADADPGAEGRPADGPSRPETAAGPSGRGNDARTDARDGAWSAATDDPARPGGHRDGSADAAAGAGGVPGTDDPFRPGTDWSDVVRWFTHAAGESFGRSGAGRPADRSRRPDPWAQPEARPGTDKPAPLDGAEPTGGAGRGDARGRLPSPDQWVRVVEIMRDAGLRIQEVLGDDGRDQPGHPGAARR